MPTPANAQGTPDGTALETFLGQEIYPLPTVEANNTNQNPWAISDRIVAWASADESPGRRTASRISMVTPNVGREFTPEVYFKTATAGARINGGFRDRCQDHGYSQGEFGAGGLYHNTVGISGFEGTNQRDQYKIPP